MSREPKSRIELDPERKKQLIAAIRAYVEEHFEDVEVGDLRAQLLLDFFLEQLAPAIYNQAVRDAAAHRARAAGAPPGGGATGAAAADRGRR